MSRNDKSRQITFWNSNSAGSVKYLIRPKYYIQIKKTWYYVYTTIKESTMYDCTKLTPTIIEAITRLNVYNYNKVYESNI